jgi:4-hydroxy-2-oxoglutarate aldolase
MKQVSLAGVFPPIVTPFDDSGAVAHDKLAENIAQWSKTPLAGFCVLGTNGEFPYLSDQEKLEVLKTARQAIPRDRLFIAGTTCESTRCTLQLTEDAARIGADVAIVLTPGYFKSAMDMQAMKRHYLELAAHSPLPIILYHMPACSGVDLTPEIVVELAQNPKIIGMKDSSGNVVKAGAVIRSAPSFQVVAGSASFLYPFMLLGAVGGICALANIAPVQCCQLYQLAKQGSSEEARQLQLQLIPANAAVTARLGVPGLKKAMDWLGYHGGSARLPLGQLDQNQEASLRKALVDSKLMPA